MGTGSSSQIPADEMSSVKKNAVKYSQAAVDTALNTCRATRGVLGKFLSRIRSKRSWTIIPTGWMKKKTGALQGLVGCIEVILPAP